jgi:hypothetical protein
LSPHTIDSYQTDLQRWIDHIGDIDVGKITPDILCTAASITIPTTGYKGGVGKLHSLINSSNNDFTNYPQLQSGVITTTITYTYDELYRLTDAVYS